MARIRTLPLRLPASRAARIPMLQTQHQRPGVVERKRGRAGVVDRDRVRQRDCWLCQPCKRAGRVTSARIVDHIIPLWAGGSDDDSNKQTICESCHDAKTAREAKERAGAG